MARSIWGPAIALIVVACASGVEEAPTAALPPPAPSAVDQPPPVAAPNVVAPGVSAPAPQPPPPPPGDIVVPGQVERNLPVTGDPRPTSVRMEHIRAWDDCVMRAQSMGEDDPTRPQLEQPEDLCRRQLGMAGRTAVPDSWRN